MVRSIQFWLCQNHVLDRACVAFGRLWLLKVRKNGQQKTCSLFCNIAANELNSVVARFTTHIKPVLQQIRLLTGLNVGGKTRNIAIQLVLQQCCKTSCMFFVARFCIP